MPSLTPDSSEAQALRQLGSRLKSARLAKNLPAGDLAVRLGISRSTLHAVERGDSSPSIAAYLLVMGALGELSSLVTLPPQEVSRVRARRSEQFPSTPEGHRQKLALSQAKAAVTELKKIGVTAELVGSVVWGQFHSSSDVDFLIIDDGDASDGTIYEAIASKLTIPFDMMFLDRLRPVSRDLILKQRAEHGRPPISAGKVMA